MSRGSGMDNKQPFEVDPRQGLAGWIAALADAGLGPDDTADDRLRKRVLTLTTMTAVAVVSIWPVTYAILGLFEAAVVPATYVMVTGLAYLLFAKTKKDILLRNVQLILLLAFPPVLQWVLGGYFNGSSVVMLAALAPVLSLMVMERKWSAVLFAVFVMIAAGLGFVDPALVSTAPTVPRPVVVGLMVLNVVGLVTIMYFPLSFYISAYERAHDALETERQRSDSVLANLMPDPIVSRLKAGEILIADQLPDVAVLFADVVGFTSATERVPAKLIVARLNEVFSVFDRLVEDRSVDKIKTIGDSYMVAAGLSGSAENSVHAVAELALAMREAAGVLSIDGDSPLQLRFGIDAGPVIAGVVGEQMLAYDLYGDVVNTASRMASHGEPNRIQVTESIRARLDGEFQFESRGSISIKGKGDMKTFFLEWSGSVSV